MITALKGYLETPHGHLQEHLRTDGALKCKHSKSRQCHTSWEEVAGTGTWSYSPSSRWCWSGRRRQSVGANFFSSRGVISFNWMAHLVRLYLQDMS